MKFLYSLSGGNHPVIREFRINKTDKFVKGKVVRYSSDNVTGHYTTGNCIGVAAEDHSGEKDILNARADGEWLRVDVTLGGVYSMPAPEFVATDTAAFGFKCSADGLVDTLTGARAVLVKKAENSTNIDAVGTVRDITEISITDGTATIKLSTGGTVNIGDVYALLPVHCSKGYLAADAESFTFVSGSGVSLTVVGCDEKTATLEVFLGSKHFSR